MDPKVSAYFLFVYLFMLSYNLTQNTVGGVNQVARIAYGSLAKPGQFPYVVHVRTRFFFKNFTVRSICSGSILTTKWVLSASHCFSRRKATSILNETTTVTAGITDSQKNDSYSQERQSAEILDHPLGESDLALVRVEQPFVFNEHVKAIALLSQPLEASKNITCTIVGFGTTETVSNTHLFYTEGNLVSCRNKLSHSPKWFDKEYECVKTFKTMTCSGDSGGPLVCAGILAGLLSGRRIDDPRKRFDCGFDGGAVSKYMSTLYFGPWIKQQILSRTGPEARSVSSQHGQSNAGSNLDVELMTVILAVLCVAYTRTLLLV